MQYLIGIDIGTSATKAVLFDEAGKAVRSHTVEYPMAQPRNGWAEQNPEDWWQAVQACLTEIGTENVAGIGLSGQMHGLVMLDAAGEVIRPAILWCDQRTKAQCDEITNLVGKERLIALAANPALPGFTAPKILWVREHEPENYQRCRHILLPKDYIRYKLTGEFATDVSDASGMLLLDIQNRRWSAEILERLQIDPALLPKVYESAEVTGYYHGIPVAGGGGDNACAAVGCGVVRAGKAFTTIGTSGVVFAHTDGMVTDKLGRIHTFCSAVPGKWHVMGVTQAAGLSLKWFRENFAPTLTYREIDDMIEQVPIGAERLLYMPYLMGERTPHLDESARGIFFGMSAMHEKQHFLRAIVEGVSYSLRDCLEILREAGVPLADMLVCGGGAKSRIWREILAGCFAMPVKTLEAGEGGVLGAAILAGVAAGLSPTVEEACDLLIRQDETQAPAHIAEYDRVYQVYRSVYPAVKPIYPALAAL